MAACPSGLTKRVALRLSTFEFMLVACTWEVLQEAGGARCGNENISVQNVGKRLQLFRQAAHPERLHQDSQMRMIRRIRGRKWGGKRSKLAMIGQAAKTLLKPPGIDCNTLKESYGVAIMSEQEPKGMHAEMQGL
eukprot:215231-Pelagomonas_calceolata.AAC.3